MNSTLPKPIADWLRLMVARKASDLFLTAGFPPAIKLDGQVTPISEQTLTPADTLNIARSVMTERVWAEFDAHNEANFAIHDLEIGRFRVSAFVQQGRMGVVFQLVNTRIPKLEELHLPSILQDIAMMPRGLVLVVGATGSGISTNLATMIGHRNQVLLDLAMQLARHRLATVTAASRRQGPHPGGGGSAQLAAYCRHEVEEQPQAEVRQPGCGDTSGQGAQQDAGRDAPHRLLAHGVMAMVCAQGRDRGEHDGAERAAQGHVNVVGGRKTFVGVDPGQHRYQDQPTAYPQQPCDEAGEPDGQVLGGMRSLRPRQAAPG